MFGGASPEHVEKSLEVLSDIAQGKMPSNMDFLLSEGRRVGLSAEMTRKIAKEVIAHPDPNTRILGYLTANGRTTHPQIEQVFNNVVEALPHFTQNHYAASIDEQLDKNSPDNAYLRKMQVEAVDAQPITGKGASNIDRLQADTADKNDLRRTLMQKMGANTQPKSYETKYNDVTVAKLRFADRIEAGVAFNPDADAKSAVRDAYDLHTLSDASNDMGQGNVIEGFSQINDNFSHTEKDFDITADLTRD